MQMKARTKSNMIIANVFRAQSPVHAEMIKQFIPSVNKFSLACCSGRGVGWMDGWTDVWMDYGIEVWTSERSRCWLRDH